MPDTPTPTPTDPAAIAAAAAAQKTPEPITLTPGTPEYDAHMVAITIGKAAPGVSAMPATGVEKFYDAKTGVYNWEDHAKEAEFKLAGGKKPDAPGDDKAGRGLEIGKDDKPGEGDVKDIVTAAGLKLETLQDEIRADGKLTDTSKAALLKQGVPEALLDEYVGLLSTHMASQATSALEQAGGQDGWNRLSGWAKENLPANEVDAYNKMLNGPDWAVAIDTLKTKMSAATGVAAEGKLLSGDISSGGSQVAFKSQAEITEAMKDPRYQTDEAYRRNVAARIAISG
jgi:hypothetical protein